MTKWRKWKTPRFRSVTARTKPTNAIGACTPGEAALLQGDLATALAAERGEDETLRDAWFEMLEAEVEASDHSEGPQDQQQDDDSTDTDIHDVSP